MKFRGTNNKAECLKAGDILWSFDVRYFPFKRNLKNCMEVKSGRSLSTCFSLAVFFFCSPTHWISEPVWREKTPRNYAFSNNLLQYLLYTSQANFLHPCRLPCLSLRPVAIWIIIAVTIPSIYIYWVDFENGKLFARLYIT